MHDKFKPKWKRSETPTSKNAPRVPPLRSTPSMTGHTVTPAGRNKTHHNHRIKDQNRINAPNAALEKPGQISSPLRTGPSLLSFLAQI